jgi:hypothetical protein
MHFYFITALVHDYSFTSNEEKSESATKSTEFLFTLHVSIVHKYSTLLVYQPVELLANIDWISHGKIVPADFNVVNAWGLRDPFPCAKKKLFNIRL